MPYLIQLKLTCQIIIFWITQNLAKMNSGPLKFSCAPKCYLWMIGSRFSPADIVGDDGEVVLLEDTARSRRIRGFTPAHRKKRFSYKQNKTELFRTGVARLFCPRAKLRNYFDQVFYLFRTNIVLLRTRKKFWDHNIAIFMVIIKKLEILNEKFGQWETKKRFKG